MHKSSKTSKYKSRDRSGPWSDWIWSEDHARYYRYRTNSDGNAEYDWGEPSAQAAAEAEDHTVPRAQDVDVDYITEGVQGLSTEYEEGVQADELHAPREYATSGFYSGASSTTKSSKSSRSKSRKGKNVATYEEQAEEQPEPEPQDDGSGDTPLDPFWGARTNAAHSTASTFGDHGYDTSGHSDYGRYGGYGPQPYGDPEPAAEPRYATEEHPRAEDGTYVPGGYGEDSGYRSNTSSRVRFDPSLEHDTGDQDQGDDDGYDAEMMAAQEESRRMQYHYGGAGPSEPDAYETSYARLRPEDDDGRATPRPSSPSAFDIQGTGGHIETLDPRYRVELSTRFQPGEIFKVLWSEPTGQVGGTPTISDRKEIRNQFGNFYVGFRRFIVIANDEGHCTCVPILTYGGKGCKKRGVKPQKHGIIHERGHKPRLLDNEPKLGFGSARMRIEADGEKLARESRVNYSKLVTVEHNVKVFFIGHIVPEDWEIVRDAVNKCWEDKIHQRRGKRPFQKG